MELGNDSLWAVPVTCLYQNQDAVEWIERQVVLDDWWEDVYNRNSHQGIRRRPSSSDIINFDHKYFEGRPPYCRPAPCLAWWRGTPIHPEFHVSMRHKGGHESDSDGSTVSHTF